MRVFAECPSSVANGATVQRQLATAVTVLSAFRGLGVDFPASSTTVVQTKRTTAAQASRQTNSRPG